MREFRPDRKSREAGAGLGGPRRGGRGQDRESESETVGSWFNPPRLGMRGRTESGSVARSRKHMDPGGRRRRADAVQTAGIRVHSRSPACRYERPGAMRLSTNEVRPSRSKSSRWTPPTMRRRPLWAGRLQSRLGRWGGTPLQGFAIGTVVPRVAPRLRACCSAGLVGPSRSCWGGLVMVSVAGSRYRLRPRRRRAVRRGVADPYRSPRSLSIRCSRSL